MIHQAAFFDGETAKAHDARVSFESDYLRVDLPERSLQFHRYRCELSTASDGRYCYIECGDGARIEIADAGAASDIALWIGTHERAFNALTRRLPFVLLALVLSVGALFLFLTDGIPSVASAISKVLPAQTEEKIGLKISSKFLNDESWFQPSSIPLRQQVAIESALASLCKHDDACPDYRLHFRSSRKFGANAFALPGGDILVTDDLIQAARNDEEVIAVLAHELGHLTHRHALRSMLESSLTAVVMLGIVGDIGSAAAALPGVMLGMKFSRDAESEADAFAYHFLSRHCIPPTRFADITDRLYQARAAKADDGLLSTLLSTHPGSEQRGHLFRTPPSDSLLANCLSLQ